MFSKSIQQLISQFTQLPGVGPRTATRYALHFAHYTPAQRKSFIQSFQGLDNLKLCSWCNYPFDSHNKQIDLCPICQSQVRNHSLLCIVEKETDLDSIERIKAYRGLYFILGQINNWPESKEVKENIKKLLDRIKKTSPKIEEVILALNSTPEGRSLSFYLSDLLRKTSVKISHLRQGLPRGGELEYADHETLQSALRERKEI